MGVEPPPVENHCCKTQMSSLLLLLIVCVCVSGGQKARVVFAELSCRQPDVLILVKLHLHLYSVFLLAEYFLTTACLSNRMSPLTIWILSPLMPYQKPLMNTKEVRSRTPTQSVVESCLPLNSSQSVSIFFRILLFWFLCCCCFS